MATRVFLHAHPDDESTQTAGMMALAHERGDRVVLVVSTDGAQGEKPVDLAIGETVADRRRSELEKAASIIGIDRISWLGYSDSGMTGWETNKAPGAFCNVDPAAVGAQVAKIVAEESADVLVHYDPHGGYGHPDHVMVHRVGAQAAQQIGEGLKVYEGTMNRDAGFTDGKKLAELGLEDMGFSEQMAVGDDGLPIGSAQSEIQWGINLPDHIVQLKQRALACHASQTSDAGLFTAMPMPAFSFLFGTEWLREPGNKEPLKFGWPL